MTKSWLSATLDADPWQHEALLAEQLPVLLETLPEGVDRWFFERGGDRLDLRFRGDRRALWDHLRCWGAEVGLADRVSVGDCPVTDTDSAVQVFHADSNTVLTQVRLAHAGALTVDPARLAALGMAELSRAWFDLAPDAFDADLSRQLALLAPWWRMRAAAVGELGAWARRSDPGRAATLLSRLRNAHRARLIGTDLAEEARAEAFLPAGQGS